MATPRGSQHRDLEQRLRDLEAQVRELSSATLRRRQLSVTSGDFVVSGGGNIVILDDADNVVWSALDGPLRAAAKQYDDNVMTFPNGGWNEYGNASIPVPDGYDRVVLSVYAAAGATFTEPGNIGVQPRVGGIHGPAISNSSHGGALSVTSFLSATASGIGSLASLPLTANAYRAGAVDAGSCNIHISASAIFLR